MCAFLETAVPRRLVANDSRCPLVVFTDAALDENNTRAGVGAVMVDGRGNPERFLAGIVPSDLLALLQGESPFVINALEVLPVFFVRTLWADYMRHRRTFIFIDNDGARHALLKSSSGSYSVSKVLHHILRTQARSPSFVWYCRVPSLSNIADQPSRGVLETLVSAGAVRDEIPEDLWARAISG